MIEKASVVFQHSEMHQEFIVMSPELCRKRKSKETFGNRIKTSQKRDVGVRKMMNLRKRIPTLTTTTMKKKMMMIGIMMLFS